MPVCHPLVICDGNLMPLVCLPDQDEALTAAMTLGVPGWAHKRLLKRATTLLSVRNCTVTVRST